MTQWTLSYEDLLGELHSLIGRVVDVAIIDAVSARLTATMSGPLRAAETAGPVSMSPLVPSTPGESLIFAVGAADSDTGATFALSEVGYQGGRVDVVDARHHVMFRVGSFVCLVSLPTE